MTSASDITVPELPYSDIKEAGASIPTYPLQGLER